MKNQNTKSQAVIYANESNIFDREKNDFIFGRNFDESSYSIPKDQAEKILEEINTKRSESGLEEAYLIEI